MPCGVPSLGIPPLSPLYVAQQDLNFNIAGINISGVVSDFRLDGLNNFTIEDLHVNILANQVMFKFNWPKINFTTNYKFNTSFRGIERAGVAKFSTENFNVHANIIYSLKFLTGTLTLNKLNLYLSVAAVQSDIDGLSEKQYLNKKLNEFIEEWILLAVNDNSERILKLANELMMPMVNKVLNTFTLSDLFNLLSATNESCLQS